VWRCAAAALGTVAALGLLEAVVRLLDIGPDVNPVFRSSYRLSENPVLAYEHVPGAIGPNYTINEDGWRGRRAAVDHSPEVFRIACIGDSVMFGYGVGDDETFPVILERLLNEHCAGQDRRFEVLNFGVTGYNAAQAAETLRTRVLGCRPDVVIYGYCLNDPSEYSYELAGLLRRVTSAEYHYYQAWTQRGARVLARSRVFLLLRYAWESCGQAGARTALPEAGPRRFEIRRGNHRDYYRALHELPEYWSRIPAAMHQIAASTRPGAAPVYVTIYPVLQDLEDYPLTDAHDRVRRAAEAEGLHVLDLTASLADAARALAESLAVDRLHPSAPGYTVAALATMNQLISDGHVEPSSALEHAAAEVGTEGQIARVILGTPASTE